MTKTSTPDKEKKKFVIGSPVSISCKWTARIGYKYRSLFRGKVNGSLQLSTGIFKRDFSSVPRDWRSIMKSEILSKNISDYEYRIYNKEKMWWNYKSWNVELNSKIKLKNIEFRDLDSLESDSDSESDIE